MDRTLARFCSVNAPCSTRMRPRCPPERCCVWIALSSCSRVTIFSSKRICPSDSVRALARCPLALGAAALGGGVGVVWGRTDARSPARSLVAGGWGLSVVGGSLAAGSVGGSAGDVVPRGGGLHFGGRGARGWGGCLTGGGGTGAGGAPIGGARS